MLAILAALTVAHNNAICSCTDATVANEVTFYFASYHKISEARNYPNMGRVNILMAGNKGAPLVSAFTPANLFAGNGYRANSDSIASSLKSQLSLNAKTSCVCYGNSGSEVTPTGTVVSCCCCCCCCCSFCCCLCCCLSCSCC